MTTAPSAADDRVPTGIKGLDHALRGGLPRNRTYLIHGGPGTGKTTIGMQFLLTGAARGERCLYMSLLQSRPELEGIVASHGWSLDGIDVVELPDEVQQASEEGQTLFTTADVELNEAADAVARAIEQYQPDRMVLDSLSEMSVLVDNPYQLRRQLLKLKRQLSDVHCTSILTSGDVAEEEVGPVETIVHGVLHLRQDAPPYGPVRRRVEITKMRGLSYLEGYHGLRIRTGGVDVYPRLEVGEASCQVDGQTVSSGNAELDTLLGGGMEYGTACLITGTTGSGKSTLASLYVQAAAERGTRAAVFCFDERRETFLRRSVGLGLSIPSLIDAGLVDLNQIDVGQLSPAEFGQRLRHIVDHEGVKVLVIDSLTGYAESMSGDIELSKQLHEVLSYLSAAGVLTLMIVTTHGLLATGTADIDASYLADTVIMMRHFEAMGSLRGCISVPKKRHGGHEKTIREVQIVPGGMRVGQPLNDFTGVLTGAPQFLGSRAELLTTDRASETHDA